MEKKIILNINSSDVSIAVAYFDSNKNMPVIEYNFTTKIGLLEKKDFKKQTMESIGISLEKVLNYLKISGKQMTVTGINVFFSSPWIRKEVSTIVDERMKPFIVDKKFLENFIAQGGEHENEEQEVIKAEILSIKANDYEVKISELEDKEIIKLEASFISSYINSKDKKDVEDIIAKYFVTKNISYDAFIITLFSQIKKIHDIKDDFAFIDFSGDVMEFGIFQDDKIRHIISMRAGYNSILKDIIKNKITKDINSAKYLLKLYLHNNIDDENKDRLDEIIDENILKIEEKIEQDIELNNIEQLPRNIFFMSDKFMNRIMEDFNFFENTFFINKALLSKFIFFNDGVNFDNFLALETEYVFS